MTIKRQQVWWLCFGISFVPLMILFIKISYQALGANPIQAIHIYLGDWALRFLCITLLITPVQIVSQWRGMAEFRKLMGLFAWFYATLHLLAYLILDHHWQWPMIGKDILESPYIWLGLIAYLILLLLAMSTPIAAKRLLAGNWKKLHRWIYFASFAAVIHFVWQLKGNLIEPLFYATIIAGLLLFRLGNWYKNRQIRKLMLPVSKRQR